MPVILCYITDILQFYNSYITVILQVSNCYITNCARTVILQVYTC